VEKLHYLNDDFEKEAEKDLVYLLEQKLQEESDIWEYENRKPAKIVVLVDESINLKKYENFE
jgi:hypothetical protein